MVCFYYYYLIKQTLSCLLMYSMDGAAVIMRQCSPHSPPKHTHRGRKLQIKDIDFFSNHCTIFYFYKLSLLFSFITYALYYVQFDLMLLNSMFLKLCRIRKFPGQTEPTMSAEVELISTMAEKKSWTRPPIQMEFQVLN